MIDLRTALKARLPMVGVTTDDPVHLEDVLKACAHSIFPDVLHVDKLTTSVLYKKALYWTDDERVITVDNWRTLKDQERTLVLVNGKPNSLVFNTGVLVPPDSMVIEKINEYTKNDLLPVLKGMSLKGVEELLLLTSAKTGNLQAKSVRKTRMALGQSPHGLYPLETDTGYYEPKPELEKWLTLNGPYFLDPEVPQILVPRGLLFNGPPGVGKSLAAKRIAQVLECPLYRLDIATTLTKYLGESEARLAQALQTLESEEPCVVLFDEVEKVFVSDSDSGAIERMLSQLLWWLQNHTAHVLPVMTTNAIEKIPPELYRPGRIDQVMNIGLLSTQHANYFARQLLTDLLKPNKPTLAQIHGLSLSSPPGHAGWSYADVTGVVLEYVKVHGLLQTKFDKASTM